MSTVGDVCTNALIDSGIIGGDQVPEASDTNTAFRLANGLAAQFNRKRWLIYSLTNVMITSQGKEVYTVGPGGDFDTPRPDRLEDGCFMRQLNTSNGNVVDYPMRVVPAWEDYNRIRLKRMGTWPSCVFYDSQFPIGNVMWWPVPQAGIYALNLLLKTQLAQFTGLTQTISLPPEYETAFSYTLQVRLRAAYRLPVDPAIVALAKDALNVLRLANIKPPLMRMPSVVLGTHRAWNVFSDGN